MMCVGESLLVSSSGSVLLLCLLVMLDMVSSGIISSVSLVSLNGISLLVNRLLSSGIVTRLV